MTTINLANLDGSNNFRLDGVSPFDAVGNPVSGTPGDMDGDGFDNVIIGTSKSGPEWHRIGNQLCSVWHGVG